MTNHRLSDLAIGQQARVLGVNWEAEAGVRMLEMGLTPGTPVRLMSTAPLGDPMVVEVRGYRLSLRRSEAALVTIDRASA